jgi:ubiquinone/menaquinone biosynthesis C-methylase UbiE
LDKSQAFWDRQAQNYDRAEEDFDQTYIRLLEKTKKHLRPGDLVLDYACGTGSTTLALAGQVKTIHGIDTSAGMIGVAESRLQENDRKNVRFAQASIFAAGLEEAAFDVILAFNILHLLADLPPVVQRIHALLKPGGLFISATACLAETRGLLQWALAITSKIGLTPHVNALKISELEAAILGGRFQVIESESLERKPVNQFVVAHKIQAT